jgi:hypothetical protein
LTGIKKLFQQQLWESAGHHSCPLPGISYRSATAVLSPVWTEPLSNAAGVLLFRRNGAHKISNTRPDASGFLKNIQRSQTGQNQAFGTRMGREGADCAFHKNNQIDTHKEISR